ncbi:hypothetical protein K432DRAFT_385926 [Lepidopterella palustris CBS 459.81]|uniref:Pyridoxamine 5'-phosphate oxidase putative domain-containing protein n=1 Tax=Lepidopterella palustris CBS 459.81 TaxID=1314670 RepID=A0A8E2E1V0_9PEZI|nr:hypothetical protein K432DRAFT_385926 [Lepidopterella palustris CBS 459.81]
MGVFYETIPDSLRAWILDQKVFWIASAPLSASGHVNVSPKGGMYFGIVDEKTFWYMDLTGSGVETTSHLHEPGNGRITVMFNAFEGPPRILRLWGKGTVLEYGTPTFSNFTQTHSIKTIPGTRSIIIVDIHQVGTSCGFSMPYFDFNGFRPTLNEFFEKRVAAEEAGKKEDGIERYWAFKNAQSMDGLPGLQRAVETAQREKVVPMKKMVGRYALKAPRAARRVRQVSLVLVALLSFAFGIIAALFMPLFVQRLGILC